MTRLEKAIFIMFVTQLVYLSAIIMLLIAVLSR